MMIFFFLHNSTATWTISPLEIFISDLKYNQIRESISLAQLPQNKIKHKQEPMQKSDPKDSIPQNSSQYQSPNK